MIFRSDAAHHALVQAACTQVYQCCIVQYTDTHPIIGFLYHMTFPELSMRLNATVCANLQ